MSYHFTKKLDASYDEAIARATEELKKEGFLLSHIIPHQWLLMQVFLYLFLTYFIIFYYASKNQKILLFTVRNMTPL